MFKSEKERRTGPFCSQQTAVETDCFSPNSKSSLKEKNALFLLLFSGQHSSVKGNTENRSVNNFSPTDTLAAWPQLVKRMKRGFEVRPSSVASWLWYPHASLVISVALPTALFTRYFTLLKENSADTRGVGKQEFIYSRKPVPTTVIIMNRVEVLREDTKQQQ